MSDSRVVIEARVRPATTIRVGNAEVPQRRDTSIGYHRAGLHLKAGYERHVVSPEQLAVLEVDPWIELRPIDEHMAAAEHRRRASEAKAKALALKELYDAAQAEADALELAAMEAEEKAGPRPAPAPAPPLTPIKDALEAARPSMEKLAEAAGGAPQTVTTAGWTPKPLPAEVQAATPSAAVLDSLTKNARPAGKPQQQARK